MCVLGAYGRSLLVRMQEETPEEDVAYRNRVKASAGLVVRSGVLGDSVINSRKVDHALHERLLGEVPGLREEVLSMARSYRTKAASWAA